MKLHEHVLIPAALGIRIDLETRRVRARFDPTHLTPSGVEALVEGQGFPVDEAQVVEADPEGEGSS